VSLASTALALTACTAASTATAAATGSAGGGGTSSGPKVEIAFVSGPLDDPFFPPLYQGAQDAAGQLPIDLNYIPIDEADIQASSAKTMEAAIAAKPDAIVVGDFVTNVVDPLIEKAVAAGIPVFVNQSGQDSWEKVGAQGFIGQFGPDVGAEAARRFAAADATEVLCVVNVAGNPYLDAICKGLDDGLAAENGSAQVLTLPSGDGTDQAKTTRDISGYLVSHPEIQGVMTLNNLTGYAAVDALAQAGKKDAPVGSLGVSRQAIDGVNSGSVLFLVNEQPYLDGYLGTIFAYTYARYGLAPVGVVKTGPQIVDKTNVDKISAVFDKYPNVIGPK
jgi:simple sugar transport system substrate-binding protein